MGFLSNGCMNRQRLVHRYINWCKDKHVGPRSWFLNMFSSKRKPEPESKEVLKIEEGKEKETGPDRLVCQKGTEDNLNELPVAQRKYWVITRQTVSTHGSTLKTERKTEELPQSCSRLRRCDS